LSVLHIGQGIIIAAGLTALMRLAGQGLIAVEMIWGDLVQVNADYCLYFSRRSEFFLSINPLHTDRDGMHSHSETAKAKPLTCPAVIGHMPHSHADSFLDF